MAVSYSREELGRGISLTRIYDKKFKSNCVKIAFISPLNEKTACVNAMLQTVLVTSNAEIPSRTKLTSTLTGLYGSSIGTNCGTIGDYQSVGLSASFIGDDYTIDGEVISVQVVRQLLNCLLRPHLVDGKFCEKYFTLRKQELIDAIVATVNDKRGYALLQAKKVIFEGEPAAVSAIGTVELAENITQEDLLRQHKKLLESAKIEITISGGGNTAAAEKLIRDEMAALIRVSPVEKIDYRHNSPAKAEPVYRELKMQVSQSKMVMAFKSDYEDIYTAKLFCMLLGATPFSKLFANVREKMSLCYYCSSAYADRKGTLFIDSGVESCNIEKAKKAIEEQLEAICNGDFTDEELENTKKSLCGGFKSNYDSIYDIMGWYAAQNTRNTAFAPEEINERIAKLTREDIISCAKTFKPDTVFVIRGEEEEDCDE